MAITSCISLILKKTGVLQWSRREADRMKWRNIYVYIYIYIYIWLSQKFCNILLTWGMIQQVWMFLPRLWRWKAPLSCVMPNSPNTLWVLVTRFVSMGWSTASESMVLSLHDLAYCWYSYNLIEISFTICLLYCNQQRLHLSQQMILVPLKLV